MLSRLFLFAVSHAPSAAQADVPALSGGGVVASTNVADLANQTAYPSSSSSSAVLSGSNVFQQALDLLPADWAWVFVALMGLAVGVAALQAAVWVRVRESGGDRLPARVAWLSVFWVPGFFILVVLVWQVSMVMTSLLLGSAALVWLTDSLIGSGSEKS